MSGTPPGWWFESGAGEPPPQHGRPAGVDGRVRRHPHRQPRPERPAADEHAQLHEGHYFTGKSVYPFTTHAMSGLGTAERDNTTACTGAAIGEGLAVQGETLRKDGPPVVTDWLIGIGLT